MFRLIQPFIEQGVPLTKLSEVPMFLYVPCDVGFGGIAQKVYRC